MVPIPDGLLLPPTQPLIPLHFIASRSHTPQFLQPPTTMQAGTVSFHHVYGPKAANNKKQPAPPSITHKITFETPFRYPPTVVLGAATHVDVEAEKGWTRYSTSITDIETTGFSVTCKTWEANRIFELTFSWMAFPSPPPPSVGGSAASSINHHGGRDVPVFESSFARGDEGAEEEDELEADAAAFRAVDGFLDAADPWRA